MNWRGIVMAALLMGAAVSCSGQVSGPAHKKIGLWGWVKGVVAPEVSGPTGTGFWKTSFVQGGTNWVCYTFWTSGTWRVTGTVTGDLLVVAGGGNGGDTSAPGLVWQGGGGAGELYYVTGTTFVSGVYTVAVGQAKQDSSFGGFTCLAGGDGGRVLDGYNGGSGGGGAELHSGGLAVNVIGLGNNGGSSLLFTGAGCGGGGAGGVGGDVTNEYFGGNGGPGIQIVIDGSNRWYAAGGGGAGETVGQGLGGSPGAGAGGRTGVAAESALANTGSGGGGAITGAGGLGGSGVVIVRVRR